VTELRTVLDGVRRHLERNPDAVALRTIHGATWTWSQYAEAACRVAAGLRSLGIRPGDRIVLMLRNRPEFHITDLGALIAGATPISVYNSSSPEQISYLTSHCEATVAVTEDGDFADRFLAAKLGPLRGLVVVGDGPSGAIRYDDLAGPDAADLDRAAAELDPASLLTVIYTSGTTGPPKGVMLDHRNVLASYSGMEHLLGGDGSDERLVSYLPMAHIAERMVSHYNHLLRGAEVTPCPQMSELSTYLVAVRPTTLFGPPRVWEKLAAGIQAAVAARPAEDQQRFADALTVGRKVQELRARGAEPTGELAAEWEFVDGVAFAPLRERIGLDACRIAFSGAAPVPPEVLTFLRDVGIEMSEVYGMSENTGGMTWEPHRVKVGRCGRAYPGNEVVTADDGEVLCRGPIVFRGYLNDPDRTREAIDDEGWLHTGDIGEFDSDGYLRIVDRKKELIITAGGKNVSPANIEAALKAIPLVGQAMAIGDDRPYLTALFTIDPDAAAARWPDRSVQELAADADVVAEVAAGVVAANDRFSRVEHVRRFVLLGEEWLPDSELLTPTMKLKRRGVLAAYAEEIERMYAGGGTEVESATVALQPS
jgi:long-chain acyl-CoA synthetase